MLIILGRKSLSVLQRGTKVMEFIGKKIQEGWSGHFELGHALNYNTQRKHFFFVSEKAILAIRFSSEQRMKYWATDNLKQKGLCQMWRKSLTREDIKRETRQEKRGKKKVSSKEISREVSTHK